MAVEVAENRATNTTTVSVAKSPSRNALFCHEVSLFIPVSGRVVLRLRWYPREVGF
jgi:hypothetical protein